MCNLYDAHKEVNVMSKTNSNTILLDQVVNCILDDFNQTFSNMPVAVTDYTVITDNTAGMLTTPIWRDWWEDYIPDFPTNKITYSGNYDKYPVSNLSVDSDGSIFLEIAVSGFSKDDIEIKQEGSYLVIEGKKKESKAKDRKYIYHDISKKDFVRKYEVNEKLNVSELKANLDNGILTIEIPLKEEARPTKKSFSIE